MFNTTRSTKKITSVSLPCEQILVQHLRYRKPTDTDTTFRFIVHPRALFFSLFFSVLLLLLLFFSVLLSSVGLNEVDIYAAVLQKSAPLDALCEWSASEEYGALLEHLLSEKGLEVHMPVIAETARALNELGFPKDPSKKFSHLSEALFCALYNNDILPEEAFIFWSEDNDTEHEGKMKLMVQTTKWLKWLKIPDEDEESSEDEDEE